MEETVCHVTTLHPRDDIRVFFKECVSLAQKSSRSVVLVVADGKGAAKECDVEIVDVQSRFRGRLMKRVANAYSAYRKVLSLRADIVHLHDPELIFIGFILRVRGFRVVYDMHENFPKQIKTKHWIPSFVRPSVAFFVGLVERVLLPSMAVVFAEKSYSKEYPWLGNTVTVLNFPRISSLLDVAPERKKSNSFCYVGAVSTQRGGIVTLKALSALREKGFSVEFECVGTVENDLNHNLIFVESQEKDWARFYGRKSPLEAWHIISGCVAGLAVLAPSPNYIDSFPTKIFEYMALGMPVIASNFPLYREVVERAGCGLLVDPENVDELEQAMMWLVEHPDEARRMGEAGREYVKRSFAWENEAKKLECFYTQLMQRA